MHDTYIYRCIYLGISIAETVCVSGNSCIRAFEVTALLEYLDLEYLQYLSGGITFSTHSVIVLKKGGLKMVYEYF